MCTLVAVSDPGLLIGAFFLAQSSARDGESCRWVADSVSLIGPRAAAGCRAPFLRVVRRVTVVAPLGMPGVASSVSNAAEAREPTALHAYKVVIPRAVARLGKQRVSTVMASAHPALRELHGRPRLLVRGVVFTVGAVLNPVS